MAAVQLHRHQSKGRLERLQDADELVLVVDEGDGEHGQVQHAPLRRREIGSQVGPQAACPGDRIGHVHAVTQAQALRGRTGDLQGQPAAFGGGAGIRSHLGQQRGRAVGRGDLEASGVGDQLHEEPVIAPLGGRDVVAEVVQRGEWQQFQPKVGRVGVAAIPLIEGGVEKSVEQPHAGDRATHLGQGHADAGQRFEQLWRHDVLPDAVEFRYHGVIGKVAGVASGEPARDCGRRLHVRRLIESDGPRKRAALAGLHLTRTGCRTGCRGSWLHRSPPAEPDVCRGISMGVSGGAWQFAA